MTQDFHSPDSDLVSVSTRVLTISRNSARQALRPVSSPVAMSIEPWHVQTLAAESGERAPRLGDVPALATRCPLQSCGPVAVSMCAIHEGIGDGTPPRAPLQASPLSLAKMPHPPAERPATVTARSPCSAGRRFSHGRARSRRCTGSNRSP